MSQNLNSQLETLKAKQDQLQKQIERRHHVLQESQQATNAEIQIKLRDELQKLEVDFQSIQVQINELEQLLHNNSSTKTASLREQEILYLGSIRDDYEPLLDVYTEMSIKGKKQHDKVKVKKTALRFLEMNHDVYSTISHTFEDDNSDSFTIDTFDALLKIIVDDKRIALIGEPGSGKSTTLQRLAYELAIKALENPLNPLPLYVRLGSYTGNDINEHFNLFFDSLPLKSYLPNRIVLLLDGLNEMPLEQVKNVEEWLERNKTVSLIISCRKLDYLERKLSLKRVDISPLDVRQIYKFIGNFFEDTDRDRLFWALAGQETRLAWEWYKRTAGFRATFENFWFGQTQYAYSYEVEKTIMKTVQDNLRQKKPLPGMLDLVSNPFLLFTVIPIYMHNEEPPKNRGELFEQFIDLLIEKRGKISAKPDQPWIDEKVQKSAMAKLAYKMILERRGTSVDELWVMDALNNLQSDQDPKSLIYFAASAGILESKRTGNKTNIRFTHQLLQEYFAALVMAEDVEKNESAVKYWPGDRWWEPTGWEETVMLLAGIQRDATDVVKWLTPINPTLAYRCATECGVPCDDEALNDLYQPSEEARSTPIARAEWGRILAKKGDKRLGVGLDLNGLPNIVWREVPPGGFIMGGDEELKSIGLFWGRLSLKLDYRFYIAKYPVTYEQFGTFVKNGYDNRKFWTIAGLRWKGHQKEPRFWEDEMFNISNHPVVGVTWYEAYAFTRWLDNEFRVNNYKIFDMDMSFCEVSLPLEAEWEKAARHPDNRRFPWGNQYIPGYANIDETFQEAECGPYNLRRATAVGIYEGGKSDLGIYDLCGNVWEWCLSKWDIEYQFPENTDPEGTEHRSLRGGSWYNSVQFAPSAAHDCLDADLAVNDVGMRLVIRPVVKGDQPTMKDIKYANS